MSGEKLGSLIENRQPNDNQTSWTANPNDLFRTQISHALHELTGVEPSKIFAALAWTNTLDKGDLILAIPRLLIKGIDPAKKAVEWAESVSLNGSVFLGGICIMH